MEEDATADVSADIDRFIHSLSPTTCDDDDAQKVPEFVEAYSKMVDTQISNYTNTNQLDGKFGQNPEKDEIFMESVKRLSRLVNALTEFPSRSDPTSLNRTTTVVQRAMSLVEDEFRNLLQESRNHCVINKDQPVEMETQAVEKMKMLVHTMVLSGFETECCQVYSIEKRAFIKEQLEKLEFDKIYAGGVQKAQWDAVEGEIARWIRVVKHCSTSLFPSERKLVESVFSHYPMMSRSLFTNLARTIVIQLLDFADAVAMTHISAEKLFKFLDMFETLRDLVPAITGQSEVNADDCEHELKSEIEAARDRIGEAAANIFCDLENSIKSDTAKTPVPGGAVHPLTRYVMNYLKYVAEYKDSLEQIFQQHHTKVEERESPSSADDSATPFSKQLSTVIDLLDANLEGKSKMYKDLSLSFIFLMNNGRYILQKVKGSTEIHQVMGDTWCRKRSVVVRTYHKNYQRETWGRLLQLVTGDGLQQHNGKISKTALKEKFKNFNNMFEEICKTQSSWVVSDVQLLSELRVSISGIVTPAYRSFLGRYKQYFDGTRSQTERYIKYQPEDIETMIEGLFEGNPTSTGKKR